MSCCGANPGMVSWLVKQALLNVAGDLGIDHDEPKTREDWARLEQQVGVKGIHIAERDTQRAKSEKPMGVFVNTWSVEGFVSEGLQPAELGWGTHEKWMPENAGTLGPDAQAIYLLQPGANTRVRSWCPTPGPQYGFLVTHNEAISISDYFTVREGGKAVYRPTCHYAYHPCNEAVLSLHEMFGSAGKFQEKQHILDENEIVDGIDELGVLLYGHGKNAYWYGSQLSIEETRRVAPYQNATGLQVTSAVLAGMVWALENPKAGIVEADEMDFRRCLEVQMPYLGPVIGVYTDWTPLDGPPRLLPGGHRHLRSVAVPERAGAVRICYPGRLHRPARIDTEGSRMPHFEEFYADKLRGGLGVADADAVLDLRDASREKAAASIQDMLERSRFAQAKASPSASIRRRRAGAKRCSSPIGKALLEAKKRGWIDRLQTLPAQDGLGFYVVLAGKPEREA